LFHLFFASGLKARVALGIALLPLLHHHHPTRVFGEGNRLLTFFFVPPPPLFGQVRSVGPAKGFPLDKFPPPKRVFWFLPCQCGIPSPPKGGNVPFF